MTSLLSLIFPPYCLHCKAKVNNLNLKICQNCVNDLIFLNKDEHCPRCFAFKEVYVLCKCAEKHQEVDAVAAVFDYSGVASSLIRNFKYNQNISLAKSIAAWMYYQYIQLGWPPLDFIIPMPISSVRLFFRGYNQSLLIALELEKLLQIPVITKIKKRNGTFSQAKLKSDQRNRLNSNNFRCDYLPEVFNKKIMIIDDVMTTGTTVEACAEAIRRENMPEAIYALTFCKTF